MTTPPRSATTRLLMASLIAAVRTVRIEPREIEGPGSPRLICQLDLSLRLADPALVACRVPVSGLVCRRAGGA